MGASTAQCLRMKQLPDATLHTGQLSPRSSALLVMLTWFREMGAAR